MPVSALAAAKHMAKRSGWSLSNLALQKLLYIAHMRHLGRTGQPLVKGRCEAWDYGPVFPDLYHRLKVFGAEPVKNILHSVPELPDGPEKSTLDEVLDHLLPLKPGQLVAITHRKDGAWDRHYKPGIRGIDIPDQDILSEYQDRTNAARAATAS